MRREVNTSEELKIVSCSSSAIRLCSYHLGGGEGGDEVSNECMGGGGVLLKRVLELLYIELPKVLESLLRVEALGVALDRLRSQSVESFIHQEGTGTATNESQSVCREYSFDGWLILRELRLISLHKESGSLARWFVLLQNFRNNFLYLCLPAWNAGPEILGLGRTDKCWLIGIERSKWCVNRMIEWGSSCLQTKE